MCTAAKNTLSFGQRGFLEKKDKTSLFMKKVFQEGLCSVSLNNKCTDDSFGTSIVAFKKQFLVFQTIHIEVKFKTSQFYNFIAIFNWISTCMSTSSILLEA